MALLNPNSAPNRVEYLKRCIDLVDLQINLHKGRSFSYFYPGILKDEYLEELLCVRETFSCELEFLLSH